MTEIIKQLNAIWYLLVFVGATIYGYAILNNKVENLVESDKKQEIKIGTQDLTLRKIEIDVAYIRAIIESKLK